MRTRLGAQRLVGARRLLAARRLVAAALPAILLTSARRLVAAALPAILLTSCGGGINAGVQGGRAFIAFTVMLLVTLGALWLAVGRGD